MIIPDHIVQDGITLKDQYFDLKGASAYSSLGESTLRDHIKKGLPCFKIGGKLLIRMSEFNQWIEGYRLHNKQDLDAIVNDVMDELRG